MLGWPVVEFVFGHVLTMRTPMGRRMRPEIRKGGGPLLRIRLGDLDRAGVERHDAKTVGVRDGRPVLADGTVLDVANVIWATGYRPDYSFVAAPIVGEDGWPIEERGVSPTVPGLYFLGVPFQYAFSSMLVAGAGRDAGLRRRAGREASGCSRRRPLGGSGARRSLSGTVPKGVAPMTDHAIAMPRRTSAMERYLAAETRLWQHYGLAPRERFVEIARPRARLRVLEAGSGPPVLFLHGTVGPGSWPSLVAGLPGFRSLVLDRPGWGLSTPVEFPRSGYRAFVADLLAASLDALDIDRVDVVGGSIGDLWALSLAEHHPDRVGRVALLGAGPLAPAVPVPPFIRVVSSPIGAIIVRLPVSPDRVRSILRDSGHGPSLDAGRIPDVVRRVARGERHPDDRDATRTSDGAPGRRRLVLSGRDPLRRRRAPADRCARAARLRDRRPDRRRRTSGGRSRPALPNGSLELIDGRRPHAVVR